MRLFFVFLYTRLKLLLTPSFITALCLFPVGIMLFGGIFNDESALKIKVGLYYEPGEKRDFAADYFRKIMGDLGEVQVYDDLEILKNHVAANKLECGFELLPSLDEGSFFKSVNLYKTQQSMTDQIASLMMVSGIVQSNSGEVAYEVLKEFFPDKEPEEIKTTVQNKTMEYANNMKLMDVNYKILDSADYTPESLAFNRVNHGLTALFAVLLTLLLGMFLAAEKRSEIYKKLLSSGISKAKYVAYSDVFIFIPVFVFLVAAQVSLGITFTLDLLLLCFGYALGLAAFAGFLSVFVKESIFPALIVFALLATALLGNCFIDISSILPQIGFIKYFFLSGYYLQGLENILPLYEAFILVLFGLFFYFISANAVHE